MTEREQLDRAIHALIEIKYNEGKVCSEFTECTHRACNSSYGAWAIADKALNDLGVLAPERFVSMLILAPELVNEDEQPWIPSAEEIVAVNLQFSEWEAK